MDNGGAFTDRLLNGAGIMPGQTALDIGCGKGDVTFRLAARVGPLGRVTGIDLDGAALDAARTRAEREGVENVVFRRADLLDLPPASGADGYDAVVCRRVLMYLRDPVRAVRAMHAVLRPGGRLVLQEHDAGTVADAGSLPLNETAHRLIWDTVRAEGADTAIGLKLHAILSGAGFADIGIMAEAVVQTADQSSPTAMIVQAMADRIVAAGTATRAELDALDPATLHDRLAAERRAAGASVVAETIFGALARKT